MTAGSLKVEEGAEEHPRSEAESTGDAALPALKAEGGATSQGLRARLLEAENRKKRVRPSSVPKDQPLILAQ